MSERPSMRFNKFQKVFKTEETFQLNERGVVPLKEGKELECDKETIYTKLYVKKVRKICLFICAKINKIRLPSALKKTLFKKSFSQKKYAQLQLS